jgi:5'-nucleotidase
MTTRRSFLCGSAAFGAALLSPISLRGLVPSRLREGASLTTPLLEPLAGEALITILNTNDTHSQIDPFPADDRQFPGQAGVARRATLVRRVRKENPNTLLVDAGDSFQGTPYFNFYKGEVEYRAMSGIGYDVGTLGNHDFDNGVAALAAAMKFASFDFVSANYDVRGTVLEKRVKRYVVRELGGVRIGLFGLGISPTGLITPVNFQGVTYQDPVEASRDVIKILKETEGCQLIVCMSHLGYYKSPKGGEIGDSQVAAQVDGIDFIASGHTHTFMKQPVVQKQPSGKETIIFQVGKSGINVGRVDFTVRAGQVTAWAGHLLDLRDDSLS